MIDRNNLWLGSIFSGSTFVHEKAEWTFPKTDKSYKPWLKTFGNHRRNLSLPN